jgi:dTDP-4-dehydrorhamnose 3,5-epimerase
MSYSKKNVLRGLHIQIKKPQGKFITVLKGKIFDVSVDLRKNSKTFGKHFSCILSEKNSKIYLCT